MIQRVAEESNGRNMATVMTKDRQRNSDAEIMRKKKKKRVQHSEC